MIDFTDPAQVTHHGRRIPVDTPEKYEAARQAASAVYLASGHIMDDDGDQQLERRVRNGRSILEIVQLTLEDRKARFDEA